jgi:hypothetical protein
MPQRGSSRDFSQHFEAVMLRQMQVENDHAWFGWPFSCPVLVDVTESFLPVLQNVKIVILSQGVERIAQDHNIRWVVLDDENPDFAHLAAMLPHGKNKARRLVRVPCAERMYHGTPSDRRAARISQLSRPLAAGSLDHSIAVIAAATALLTTATTRFHQPVATEERPLNLEITPPDGGRILFGFTAGGMTLSPSGR